MIKFYLFFKAVDSIKLVYFLLWIYNSILYHFLKFLAKGKNECSY